MNTRHLIVLANHSVKSWEIEVTIRRRISKFKSILPCCGVLGIAPRKYNNKLNILLMELHLYMTREKRIVNDSFSAQITMSWLIRDVSYMICAQRQVIGWLHSEYFHWSISLFSSWASTFVHCWIHPMAHILLLIILASYSSLGTMQLIIAKNLFNALENRIQFIYRIQCQALSIYWNISLRDCFSIAFMFWFQLEHAPMDILIWRRSGVISSYT